MSRSFQLTPDARSNLEEISSFVAEESVEAAIRLLDEFELAFERLARHPGIGHKREDLTPRPVKFWSVYAYLIVYDPASCPLNIVAVLHGARDVERLLKEQ